MDTEINIYYQNLGGGYSVENFILRISAIEIPVSNLESSINWYVKLLGLEVQYRGSNDAMLTFNAIGVPGIFLCQTEDNQRLQFVNTSNGITHSVVDFYTSNLEEFRNYLIKQGVEVGKLNMNSDHGGFGFKDPDGNFLSACNAIQRGQV
ncbi:VOC family protein [Paenibacillus sp. S3N08]|uniref:VOC family protein n=2 Tax=Paenibacillus agricola TaxID=2716264 RepID=A0ABX0JFL1_9BACL|nr:VOC family protein [Paenibacillus agricola]